MHKSPIVYRHIDGSITVPLWMIEFNLIWKTAKKEPSAGMFWKLLVGTAIVLAFGYAGETKLVNGWIGLASTVRCL